MEEGEISVTGSINNSRFGGVSAFASRLPEVLQGWDGIQIPTKLPKTITFAKITCRP